MVAGVTYVIITVKAVDLQYYEFPGSTTFIIETNDTFQLRKFPRSIM